MSIRAICVAALAGAALACVPWPGLAGEPSAPRGKAVFEEQCSICHVVAPGKGDGQGPPLNGVVGRPAGSAPGFSYSKGMKSTNTVWTRESLDRFLADPPEFIPGTSMPINVADAKDRADLIAFLATTR